MSNDGTVPADDNGKEPPKGRYLFVELASMASVTRNGMLFQASVEALGLSADGPTESYAQANLRSLLHRSMGDPAFREIFKDWMLSVGKPGSAEDYSRRLQDAMRKEEGPEAPGAD